MHPDTLLVTGMRGAGKTFWWTALQQISVRRLLGRQTDRFPLSENDTVRTGFGVVAALDDYPSKDVLQQLITMWVGAEASLAHCAGLATRS